MSDKLNPCPHCKFLENIFSDIEITNEIHFIATSIFVYLHNCHSYCDCEKLVKDKEKETICK